MKLNRDGLISLPNMSDIRADMLLDGCRENRDLWERLEKFLKIEKPKKTGEKKMEPKSVCFTGKMEMPRKEMEALADAYGLSVASSVSKNLTYLVCADPDSGSGKMKKARSMGVEVISEVDFLKMVG